MDVAIFHKVTDVKPLADYRLLVCFSDGEEKHYDVSRFFSRWDSFLALKHTPCLFEQVRVDAGGYGISWNDDIDISCEELYRNAIAPDGARMVDCVN
jgi:hypothetical protein